MPYQYAVIALGCKFWIVTNGSKQSYLFIAKTNDLNGLKTKTP